MSEGGTPDIDFATFVMSLRTGALVQLGEVDGQAAASPEVSLALARQTVEILAMLEAKTKGNLTGEEERILHEVLVDLRLRWAAARRARA